MISPIQQHTDLLAPDCALYADVESADRVAEAILAALADRDAAQARARRASEHLQDWSVRRAAERYVEVYRGVTERTVA